MPIGFFLCFRCLADVHGNHRCVVNKGQITDMAIILPVVLLALLLSETIAMEQQLHSSDDGFCVKTDEGVRCISAKDITLTRFDSQQVC